MQAARLSAKRQALEVCKERGAGQKLCPFAHWNVNMPDRPRNQFDDEFSARANRREMESLHESPLTDRIGDAAEVVGTVAGVGSALIPPAAAILAPVSIAASFFGTLRKALRSGKPTAERMIEELDTATDNQVRRILSRIEALENKTERQREFEDKLNSHEAQIAMLNECFHALRTSDPAKHERLAVLTVNSIFEGDLNAEILDGMMRATVELTEHDIDVLGSIYKMQIHLFSPQEMQKEYRWRVDAIRSLWEQHWDTQAYSSYQGVYGQAFNSSFARLQSAGLIGSIGTKTILRGPTMHDYELLPEGKKFYERVQEIAVEK